MLVKRDLGFTSPVFLVVVVVVPVILLILRQKWRQSVARSEEVKRLLISASEESARVEFEAREAYYYTATATPSPRVSASTLTPSYTSVPLVSSSKQQHQCAVCFCPTTTRCAKCKAVRYCSGKCQIIHWRQGHKNECRPYVAVSPINDVAVSSYRQGSPRDHNDSFVAEAKQSATPTEIFPGNSHHKDADEIESFDLQQVTNATSESNSPLLHKGQSIFSTPTNFSASENFETVISAHRGSPSSARKSALLGSYNQKRSNLSDEDAQSGTSSSSFWTGDGINESSLSEPSPPISVFWDVNIRTKKSTVIDHDEFTPGSFSEAANGYMANHTANGVPKNITNGLRAAEVKDKSGLTGLGSKRCNDLTDSSKDSGKDGSGVLTHRDGSVGSDLLTSKFRESKSSISGSASHRPVTAAVYSTSKDDKFFGAMPSGSEKLNFSNKITTPDMSKPREVVPSLSSASDTYLTSIISKHISHFTKPVKIDDDNNRVTTCSSQLTENSVSVRSGSKTSKVKAVDHLKNSKLSRQESSEGGSDTTHRYSFNGLFPYDTFVKLYNWKQIELQPCGFKNCGNSCYANAVLQCLVYTPPLTAYLLEGLHSKACDKRGWCFTCELEGLVMKTKDGNSSLSPIRILTHIENIGSNLGHGKEEDAHEFLRYVIEAWQSACIKEAGTYTLNSLEEETTLIGLTFGGYLRSKIICMKCGGKSERHERMMDLTVEIEGNIGTLEEALNKFTSTEILDGENKYKCSRCKSFEKAKKKLTLLEAPNVLTIALKRFQSGKFGKLNKSIHFPEILDMAPYVRGTSDKSPIYRLYGVVVHVDTMNAAFSGHYVCYVKNFENRWFKFDDSMVKEVELQHVLTKGAYMLLYARCSPRAPRSIRSSLIHHHDPRKHKITPSFAVSKPHSTEPWDACNYHPQLQVRHRSLEEESSSSSDNSGFFSESCSCITESTNYRDSTTIEEHISGDWEHDYHRNMSLNSSDSDTSSTSSFPSPSPLYSRLSHLYTLRTNTEVDRKVSKCNVCRNLDCSCNSCRVTNLDRLGAPATNPTSKPSVTFRRSMTRGTSD